MIKLYNLDIVKRLLDKDPVGTANFYGATKYQKNVEIFVDNINNPTGVLVRGERFNLIHSKNEDFIMKVRGDFLGKGIHEFSGVDKKTASILKKNVKVEWEESSHLYHLPKKKIRIDMIKNKVRSIDPKDVNLINDHYTYKSDHSLKKLLDNINNRPSAAIYEGDEIVSWVMTHDEGSMGVMYTLEKARKKGYAVDLTYYLADQIVKEENIPFVHIVEGNFASVALAKKCGFEHHGDIEWFGIRK